MSGPSSLFALNVHFHTETINHNSHYYSQDAVRVAVVNQGESQQPSDVPPQQAAPAPSSLPIVSSSLIVPSSDGSRSVALMSGSYSSEGTSLALSPSAMNQTPFHLVVNCLPHIVAGIYSAMNAFNNPNSGNVQENAKRIKENMERVVGVLKEAEATGRSIHAAFGSIGTVANAILFNA